MLRSGEELFLGFADDDLSFDDSSNVVGGTLQTKGYSLMLYAQQEWDNAYRLFPRRAPSRSGSNLESNQNISLLPRCSA
jgi:hypothetical protein